MPEKIIEEHIVRDITRVKETEVETVVTEHHEIEHEHEIEVEILPTGMYTIRTVPSLQLVGRNIVEDASPDPKGVYGQPLGVPLNPNTTFMLRHVGGPDGDSYHLSVGRDRGRVVAVEGRVAAVLNVSGDVGDIVDVGGGRGRGPMGVQDMWGMQEVDAYDQLPVDQRWAVRRQPQHGDDVYTIESENGYWGWVMPTEHPQYTRVAVRQLTSTAAMPPMYPPTMLWLIERIG
ncbi:hypothetical protein D9756_008820 [Leucocoprinus leucothites]|uniref:Uncharacterized protein n=1 Tax=Leucocoprinus leucothites TaxID=201217 RepID=A0A8H5CYL3_9AGAR|nr:hypothetical protein D9756_008820 [Leucoagaricus leucothites]